MLLVPYILICVGYLLPCAQGIEPISSTVGVVGGILVSAGYAGWTIGKCKIMECCDAPWVKLNYTGLQSSLQRALHGQHLVEHIVARSIKAHVNNKNPRKALVLAFHGGTGSGKNFASNLIASNLYKDGMNSKFVHLYIATQHFPHSSKIEEYKAKLQKEIKEYTQLCGQSFFIFDELDKMPVGVIDVLKPYIDYYDDVDGIDYRRNIFIFLSNAGANEINRIAFNFWMADKDRETLTMKDIEPAINAGAFNERGGLQYSDIVKHSLIDLHIPFLPLEKKHVKLCVQDVLRARSKYNDDSIIEQIADQLLYEPTEFQLYSASGCKKVSQKVDLYVDDD